MWSAQAVHELKIDHTQCHLSALRGTWSTQVQWVDIGAHTHTHTHTNRPALLERDLVGLCVGDLGSILWWWNSVHSYSWKGNSGFLQCKKHYTQYTKVGRLGSWTCSQLSGYGVSGRADERVGGMVYGTSFTLGSIVGSGACGGEDSCQQPWCKTCPIHHPASSCTNLTYPITTHGDSKSMNLIYQL